MEGCMVLPLRKTMWQRMACRSLLLSPLGINTFRGWTEKSGRDPAYLMTFMPRPLGPSPWLLTEPSLNAGCPRERCTSPLGERLKSWWLMAGLTQLMSLTCNGTDAQYNSMPLPMLEKGWGDLEWLDFPSCVMIPYKHALKFALSGGTGL